MHAFHVKLRTGNTILPTQYYCRETTNNASCRKNKVEGEDAKTSMVGQTMVSGFGSYLLEVLNTKDSCQFNERPCCPTSHLEHDFLHLFVMRLELADERALHHFARVVRRVHGVHERDDVPNRLPSRIP